MRLQLNGHKLNHHLEELMRWNSAVDAEGQVVDHANMPTPLHFDFGPTAACNYNYVHCYVKELPEQASYLRRDIYEQLMIDMPQAGVKSIFLAGRGEPLMHKDTPDMIPIGTRAGLDIGLLTNGVLFTPETGEQLMEHLVFTRFNILGDTPRVYSHLMGTNKEMFHRSRKNLEHASNYRQKNGLKTAIGLYICVFPENVFELHSLCKWGKEAGADYAIIKPAGQFIDASFKFERNMHEKYRAEIEKTQTLSDENFNCIVRMDSFDVENTTKRKYDKCLGIDFLGIIDADGNIGTCNGFWKVPEAQYGNLYEKSFAEIFRSQNRYKARDYINDEVDCHKCDLCRQHQSNSFLWDMKHPPDHINFI